MPEEMYKVRKMSIHSEIFYCFSNFYWIFLKYGQLIPFRRELISAKLHTTGTDHLVL